MACNVVIAAVAREGKWVSAKCLISDWRLGVGANLGSSSFEESGLPEMHSCSMGCRKTFDTTLVSSDHFAGAML